MTCQCHPRQPESLKRSDDVIAHEPERKFPRPVAVTVAAQVECNDPEALRQRHRDRRPVSASLAQRVQQNHWRSIGPADDLVRKTNAIDPHNRASSHRKRPYLLASKERG